MMLCLAALVLLTIVTPEVWSTECSDDGDGSGSQRWSRYGEATVILIIYSFSVP